MPRKESTTMPASAQAQQDAVSEGIENLELPRSLVMRLAKSAVPEGTKLQKDTVTALVKGSTVFINYLAAVANDVSQSKQHKSVSASDVLKALEIIDFADLVGPLQQELKHFKNKRARTAAASAGTAAAATGDASPSTSANAPKQKLGRPKKSPAAPTATTDAGADAAPPRDAGGDGDAEMVDGDREGAEGAEEDDEQDEDEQDDEEQEDEQEGQDEDDEGEGEGAEDVDMGAPDVDGPQLRGHAHAHVGAATD